MSEYVSVECVYICVCSVYVSIHTPTGLARSEAHELLPSKKFFVRIYCDYCLHNFVCMFVTLTELNS